jgi:MerR family transcriptional regulator, redox-sensitive transcriptional activator SoxR
VTPAPTMTIGQVAQEAAVPASRIRYYEQIGVLPEPERLSGQRRYADDVVRRLAIVAAAQRVGLSLAEIRDLTSPTTGRRAGEGVRAIAERRLPDIDALIEHAQAVKRWLEVAKSCDCATVDVCGLFVDPALLPPPGEIELTVHRVGAGPASSRAR